MWKWNYIINFYIFVYYFGSVLIWRICWLAFFPLIFVWNESVSSVSFFSKLHPSIAIVTLGDYKLYVIIKEGRFKHFWFVCFPPFFPLCIKNHGYPIKDTITIKSTISNFTHTQFLINLLNLLLYLHNRIVNWEHWEWFSPLSIVLY